MNWLDAIPVALAAAGWLFVPGLLASYAIGLRGITAWAIAPTVSVGVVAATAVVAGMVGIPWSAPLVLVVSVVVAVVLGLAALLLRRRFDVVRKTDPPSLAWAALIGMAPAVVIGAVVVVQGIGSPETLSQTYDAVFHYNAIAYIVDSGNASSLTLNSLGTPGTPGSFYPSAWHDFASLLVLTTGASAPVAANVLTGVLAVVVWPLNCMGLIRQLAGRSTPAILVTGLISVGFSAFPWALMAFGVLWPNTLGLTLLPAALGAVLSLAGFAKDDAIGRGRAWLLLPVILVAGGLSHPNSLFSLVAVAVFPLFASIGRWAVRQRAAGRTGRGLLGFGVAAAAFLLAWGYVAVAPAFAGVRGFFWPPFETAPQAIGEALLGATNHRPALWALSAAVLVGVVLLWRRFEQNWLIGAFAGTAGMFVLTASVNSWLTAHITGYWYNDPFRLAAIIPLVAVPLAVLGLVALAECLRDRFTTGDRPRLGALGRSATALTVVLALVVFVLAKGMYAGQHWTSLAVSYSTRNPVETILNDKERTFFAKVKDEVPADVVVANNPWDGSSLLWALDDRMPLYRQLNMQWSDAQLYLAKHLVNMTTDPKACAQLRELNVGYLLVGKLHFRPYDANSRTFPGIVDPAGRPGFQLVDSDGDTKLYKLTAC